MLCKSIGFWFISQWNWMGPLRKIIICIIPNAYYIDDSLIDWYHFVWKRAYTQAHWAGTSHYQI